jgi:uncharacterized protein with HEPN domain
MSRRADLARLERLESYISDIFTIVERHGSIADTLNDLEGQYAIMLCLTQIGEQIGKIEDPDFVSQLPVRMAAGLRNIIVHNYEGVELTIIGNTVRDSLPELRTTIRKILEEQID